MSSSYWAQDILTPHNSIRGLPPVPLTPQDTPHAADFWIPQVTPDGQIYYANTQTGELSRDLPKDAHEDMSDGEMAGLTAFPSSSRTGATSALGLTSPSDPFGIPFGAHKPHQYPVSVLADRHPPSPTRNNGSARGSLTAPLHSSPFLVQDLPQGRARAQTDSSPSPSYRPDSRLRGLPFDSLTTQLRHRSNTTADRHPDLFSPDHPPMPCDDARPRPFRAIPTPKKELSISIPHNNRSAAQSRPRLVPSLGELQQVQEHRDEEQHFQSEQSSRNLQQALAPSSPELVSELLNHARQSIVAIMACFREFGVPREPAEEQRVDNFIEAAIAAIRDLLYVSGPSLGHIPRNLSRDSRGRRHTTTASHTLLVPAQRRAIATLSKFILSARAILNDAPWNKSNSTSHLQNDADELDRSLVDFVSTVQRCRNQEQYGGKGLKRLHGHFSVSHIGLGKAGAGAAGSWKGYGWVDIDANEEAPRRSLDPQAYDNFRTLVMQLQAKFSAFTESLHATKSSDIIISESQDIMVELSSFLSFVSDLHIARHVDIESVNQSKLSDGEKYLRSVEKARSLVRSFEATTQSLFDDGSALLMTTQSVRHLESCEVWRGRDKSYDVLERITSSLKINLQVALQVLESLLYIGQEQTEILERDNTSPVEWRMSLLSLEGGNMADALRAMSNGSFEPPADEADLPKTAHQSIFSAGAQNGHSPVVPPPIPADGKPVAYSADIPWDVRDDDALGLTTKAPRPSDSKIRAFFGTDAPQHYLETINADAKPWYLRPNYDSAEILLDPDGTVRGGTVPALVERLTAHEYADPKFIKAFLMTYKSFTNLDTLFTLLVERFWIQPPENLNAAQLGEWRKFKQYIIRTRVMNTVKSMVQDTDVLEKEDMYILDRLQDFVSRDEVINLPAAKSILDAIKRAQRGRDNMTIKTSHHLPPPPPIVPKRIDLLDIDALELARQLTITESQLYLKIRPIECLHRSKQQKTDYNDNIAIFIRRSNRIANWVAYAVLCKEDSRRRASVMKHFINIADRCRSLQNFSTMLAIVSGLNSSPIRRLKRSWEQVSAKMMSQLETCETTINSYKNFNIYRSALAKVSPPCVPFIGVFLTALTHIQDGSKDSLPGHLVNFRKRQKASEVIQDLQQWQAQPHNFRGLPSVLAYIENSLDHFGDKDVGDDFWDLSLAREPREKEEEKLARLLHESGFF